MKKLFTGLLLFAGMAIVAIGSKETRADEIYLKDQCRAQGYSTYNSLAYYHLYTYYSNVYLQLYVSDPYRRNFQYLLNYFTYGSIAANYYYAYWSQDYYLKQCQYPPKKKVVTITYTSVSTSTRTATAANGAVITYTQVQTSTKTATSTAK